MPAQTIAPRERTLAIVGIMLAMFLAALDQTIVSTAMPAISEDLHGLSLYAWVATSYMLATVVALPLFGRLTELAAAKWVLLAAVLIFLGGSILSGLSQSMLMLVIFRGVQGIGGGALFAIVFVILAMLFPPRDRGRVGGLFGAVWGISSVVGPYLGGFLTDNFSWHWVFFVNMPLGAIALFFILVYMPRLEPAQRGRFDYPGMGAIILFSVPLALAASWGGSTYPWASPEVIGGFVLAAIGLLLFLRVESRSPEPLFDLRLFRSATFRWSAIGSLLFGAAFLGAIIFLPLYLVQVQGYSASHSGLALTPLTLGIVVSSALSGQIASRTGRLKPLLLGGAILAIVVFALIWLVLSVTMPLWEVLVLMVLLGLGFGPSMPLFTLAAQNAVPRERTGTATSAAQFARQIGSTLGIALLGTILAGTIVHEMPRHLPAQYRAQAARFDSSQVRDTSQLTDTVRNQFSALSDDVTAALKGDADAFARVEGNPSVPAKYKQQLTPGGIPAQVAQQVDGTLLQFRKALQGDAGAKAALLADPHLPGRLKQVLQNPPADDAGRAAAFQQAAATLHRAEPQIVAQTEQQVIPQVQAGLKKAASTVVADLSTALNYSITAAVKKVYLFGGIFSLLSLVAILLMPDEELKGGSEA